MKKLAIVLAGIMTAELIQADNLSGVDEFICAAAQVQICIENDTCYAASPEDLNVPEFIVISLKGKTVSTTEASGLNRSTEFTSSQKSGGLITLQGKDGEKAFSFVIEEAGGHLTAAIASDGLSVSVFGVCTDTDL